MARKKGHEEGLKEGIEKINEEIVLKKKIILSM